MRAVLDEQSQSLSYEIKTTISFLKKDILQMQKEYLLVTL